ncbi:hypothetical protein A2999_00045 [Candidatus Wolfebacteria bacterium RIFCSPLOWO2_01_FULL_38_11]|uniref:Uncharacterized protein n=2 Tax=Candidatus Wolfeibacteriota TaxID=1752735 RepID=A0A0G0FWL5_9BACT|nr:MAG: hypothetical protein US36_C0001G0007 [Candidatus Wolfebacteria bacterium GW2011_GWC1_37_10]OGM90345.1 MAG: hypothetical protein A2999_00045 [Candidatus Wolfebacteria bacterium RIFCSPLOWO2_01_FULL_38_11]
MSDSKSPKAFTLVELLIYISIFSVVSGLMVGIITSILRVNQRETASAEATAQLNFIHQTISRLVRDSSAIIANSTEGDVSNDAMQGTPQSRLVLRMEDSGLDLPNDRDPIVIWKDSATGAIKMSEGTSTPRVSDLTNSKVVADNLEFTKYSQYPGHDVVSVDIQLTTSSTNPQSVTQRALKFAVARVSAATFDSDLLPGIGNQYDIGSFSGTGWRKILMNDGSNQNPSYTFTNSPNTGIFSRGADLINFTTNQIERMVIDNNGNVGIGTTTPTARLESKAPTTGSYNTAFRGRSNDEGDYIDLNIQNDGKANFGGNFTNFGIGTTDPLVKFSVSTAGVNDGIGVYGNSSRSTGLLVNLESGAFNNITQANDNGIIWMGQTRDNPGAGFVIAPWRSDTSGIRLDASGNVGIGTTNPGTKLDVAGNIKFSPSFQSVTIGPGGPASVSLPSNTSLCWLSYVSTDSGGDCGINYSTWQLYKTNGNWGPCTATCF